MIAVESLRVGRADRARWLEHMLADNLPRLLTEADPTRPVAKLRDGRITFERTDEPEADPTHVGTLTIDGQTFPLREVQIDHRNPMLEAAGFYETVTETAESAWTDEASHPETDLMEVMRAMREDVPPAPALFIPPSAWAWICEQDPELVDSLQVREVRSLYLQPGKLQAYYLEGVSADRLAAWIFSRAMAEALPWQDDEGDEGDDWSLTWDDSEAE